MADCTIPVEERLYGRIETIPEVGCWIFIGALDSSGYGQIMYKTRKWIAHRLSWFLTNGGIPAGMYVCHKCDTPSCINPSHLFLGTCKDNHADRNNKNRQAKGVANGNSVLGERDVKNILLDNRPIKIISSAYGVCEATIWNVKNRRTWRHV